MKQTPRVFSKEGLRLALRGAFVGAAEHLLDQQAAHAVGDEHQRLLAYPFDLER